jgi:hypothetical protein
VLSPRGIRIAALIGRKEKQAALEVMGLSERIGGSKLDVGLYLEVERERRGIFGGVHVKASLAERVSDDVPAPLDVGCEVVSAPAWRAG